MKMRVVVPALLVFGMCNMAQARSALEQPVDFEIGTQSLNSALSLWSKQAGLQVLIAADVQGRVATAVRGSYPPQDALKALLRDAPLSYQLVNASTVSIQEVQADGSGGGRGVPSGESLEQIVVTATKRQMNIQDVPFALSAMSGSDLDRMGATGARDYLSEVAGVHYTALGRGRSPIVIRGVSTEGSNINNLQNTIETYVDDLPTLNRFSAWTNTDLNTFDVERVEVLRGPQGTLFGSGAIGGAIRIITNKPDFSNGSSRVELGLGSTERGDDAESANAMVNLPLVQDKLALRGVGYIRTDAGYVDNVHRQDANVDGGRTAGGRMMLGYAATDRANLRLSATYERAIVDDSAKTFADGAGADTYRWNGIIPERSDVKLGIYNLVADYNLDGATLTSSTTYARRRQFLRTDFIRLLATIFDPEVDTDTLDAPENDAWIKHDTDTFAQELRLTSRMEGPWEWTAGGFFMKQNVNLTQFGRVSTLPDALVYNEVIPVESKEKALFGEFTYRLSKAFSATVGMRWFDNAFALTNSTGPGEPGVFDAPDFPSVKTSSSAVTPKVSLSFEPREAVLLYTTAAKGYRVGQTNFGAGQNPQIPTGFGPDSLWNYELGFKSIWFERLKVNLAAFYIDWNNIQLQRIINLPDGNILNPIVNAGKATIKGAEAEITVKPGAGWEIGTALSYTHARLDSVLDGVPLVTGSTLPGSPDFSASNYLQFMTSALPLDLSGYVRLTHRYVGEVYGDINNSAAVRSDPYNTFDAHAGVVRGAYELALDATNLANDDSVVSRPTVFDTIPYVYRNRPRTIGVTFRATF